MNCSAEFVFWLEIDFGIIRGIIITDVFLISKQNLHTAITHKCQRIYYFGIDFALFTSPIIIYKFNSI